MLSKQQHKNTQFTIFFRPIELTILPVWIIMVQVYFCVPGGESARRGLKR